MRSCEVRALRAAGNFVARVARVGIATGPRNAVRSCRSTKSSVRHAVDSAAKHTNCRNSRMKFGFAHWWFLFALLLLPLFAWLRGKRGARPAFVYSSVTLLKN